MSLHGHPYAYALAQKRPRTDENKNTDASTNSNAFFLNLSPSVPQYTNPANLKSHIQAEAHSEALTPIQVPSPGFYIDGPPIPYDRQSAPIAMGDNDGVGVGAHPTATLNTNPGSTPKLTPFHFTPVPFTPSPDSTSTGPTTIATNNDPIPYRYRKRPPTKAKRPPRIYTVEELAQLREERSLKRERAKAKKAEAEREKRELGMESAHLANALQGTENAGFNIFLDVLLRAWDLNGPGNP